MSTRFEFSNFLPFDEPLVDEDGIEYRTVENYFQAMKTTDKELRKKIAALSPGEAKKAGRKLELRSDWEKIKEDIMLFALRWKFRPGTKWAQKLLATGKEEIIEYNTWHDNYWGCCTCTTCKGTGQNRLGFLLMKVRADLKKQKVLNLLRNHELDL